MVNHSTIQDSGSIPDTSTYYPHATPTNQEDYYPEDMEISTLDAIEPILSVVWHEPEVIGEIEVVDLVPASFDKVTLDKELILWLIYYEQMWKTLVLNFAVLGGEEAQKFGSEMIQNYKKQFPTLDNPTHILNAILADPEGVKSMYSKLFEQIESVKETDSVITEL